MAATRVAMVGGGAMGGAIVEGLVGLEGVDVTVVEADTQRAQAWRERADVDVSDATSAAAEADVVVVAVKPHHVVDVLREIGPSLREGAIVVSIAAGVTLEVLERESPAGTPIVRTMPNTPVRVGRGVVGLSAGSNCTDSHVAMVSGLLSPVAHVVPVDEELIDALTATSGSGPAYLFYLAEAMQRGAAELGLPEDVAANLVAQTLVGAAELLAAEPGSARELRASVTSKGGTTAAATAVFDAAHFDQIVVDAMRANRDRARELAEGTG